MPPATSADRSTEDDLRDEHALDYAKAKPNRFAGNLPQGARIIVLEPDVARVFTDPAKVNDLLRALIRGMPGS